MFFLCTCQFFVTEHLKKESSSAMKINFLTSLFSGGFFALTAILIPTKFAVSQTTEFFCDLSAEVPVTYAITPRGNVPVIRWQSNFFSDSGYTPQRRCEEVSTRFQTYKNNGSLSYITVGIMNGQPVVCVTSTMGGGCQGLLLTLRPTDNANQVVQQMFDLRVGASGPIQQNSSRTYIDFQSLLDNTPVEEINLPSVEEIPLENQLTSTEEEIESETETNTPLW